MKISNSKKCNFKIVSLILSCWLILLCYSEIIASDEIVYNAYLLRMNGQADSAKVLLEKILAEDSTNAEAWFELARTKHHIGLGNPRQLFAGLDDLQHSTKRAVELQPDNIIYGFYNGSISFLLAYASMMRNQPGAKDKIGTTIADYEALLELKPDYKEAMLFLVEALSVLEDMGGNLSEAQKYTEKLAKLDPVLGAKARELILPQDADRVEYWKKALKENKGNSDVTEQLGKAYLYQGEIEEGEQYLENVMKIDSRKSILLMDMARFYLMQSRQDTALAKTVLPKADHKIQKFLETNPIRPVKAFALNMQSGIKQMLGFTEEANTLRAEANRLDPNVSKAFAVPGEILFSAPDEVSHYHSYFFRPF